MKFIIVGRNIEVTPGLRAAVEEKIGKLDKYFNPDTEVHVTLSVEKDRQKMAVTANNSKDAITHFTVLENFKKFAYIKCQLETGRTHQIRVHMSSIHHPIVGDDVYGPAKCPFSGLQGQTLHDQVLGFIHPRTGEYMEFSAPLPEYFEHLLTVLEK